MIVSDDRPVWYLLIYKSPTAFPASSILVLVCGGDLLTALTQSSIDSTSSTSADALYPSQSRPLPHQVTGAICQPLCFFLSLLKSVDKKENRVLFFCRKDFLWFEENAFYRKEETTAPGAVNQFSKERKNKSSICRLDRLKTGKNVQFRFCELNSKSAAAAASTHPTHSSPTLVLAQQRREIPKFGVLSRVQLLILSAWGKLNSSFFSFFFSFFLHPDLVRVATWSV